MVARRFYFARVKTDYTFYYIKTEPCAFDVIAARLVNFIKSFKYLIKLFGRNSVAAVSDRDIRFFTVAERLKRNISAVWGELCGVVD